MAGGTSSAPPETSSGSPLGIVAGRGPIPLAVAEAAREEGRAVFIVGIPGETEKEIECFPHEWIKLGALGRTVRAFKSAGCEELVMIGPLTRPELSSLKLDWGGVKFLSRFVKLMRQGDDGLLRGFVDFFEKDHGFRVIPAEQVLKGLAAPPGCWTVKRPDEQAERDIVRGRDLLNTIGRFDMGQGTVICRGIVLAIEGPEGTDAMLTRVAGLPPSLRAAEGSRAGVLVKLPKPDQDRRVDLPTIGVTTVENAARAELAGIAVETSGALVVEFEKLIARANELGLFVVALEGGRHG